MYKALKNGITYLLLLAIGFSFFYHRRVFSIEKQIQTITYENFSWGKLAKAVTIDFNQKEKKLYHHSEFHENDFQSIDEVPESLIESSSLDFVDNLHKNLIATNVSFWKKNYTKENVLDGYQWSVSIVYQDGTTKFIHGSNTKPRKYDELVELLL